MAIRASNVVLIYFVIGAVMFGGGAVAFQDSGLTTVFLEQSGNSVSPDNDTAEKINGTSGSITNLIGLDSGPVLLVWNLVTGIVTFIHWPIVVLTGANAPIQVVVLLGGSLTAMFYMAMVKLVRSSA